MNKKTATKPKIGHLNKRWTPLRDPTLKMSVQSVRKTFCMAISINADFEKKKNHKK